MTTYKPGSTHITTLISGNYTAVLGTNMVSDLPETSSFGLATLVDSDAATSGFERTITVAAGVDFLIGGVGDWQSGEVSNASMWVKTPSGTLLKPIVGNTPTTDENSKPHEQNSGDPNASSFFLLPHSDGSVLGFILRNPAPGDWTVGLNHDDSVETPAFEINVSTVTSGGMKDIQQAYKALYEQKHPSNSLALSNGEFPWACVACQIGAFALALIIFIVAASLASLTEESAIVVSLAETFSTTPANVMKFIRNLVDGGEPARKSIKWVLTDMCKFFGAC